MSISFSGDRTIWSGLDARIMVSVSNVRSRLTSLLYRQSLFSAHRCTPTQPLTEHIGGHETTVDSGSKRGGADVSRQEEPVGDAAYSTRQRLGTIRQAGSRQRRTAGVDLVRQTAAARHRCACIHRGQQRRARGVRSSARH